MELELKSEELLWVGAEVPASRQVALQCGGTGSKRHGTVDDRPWDSRRRNGGWVEWKGWWVGENQTLVEGNGRHDCPTGAISIMSTSKGV